MFSRYLLFIYRRIVKRTVKNGLLSARPPTPNRFLNKNLSAKGKNVEKSVKSARHRLPKGKYGCIMKAEKQGKVS